MDQRVPGVEIIGVVGFVVVHGGSNDKISRLFLCDRTIWINGPLLRRQELPAQQPGVFGIFIPVMTKPVFEFAKLVCGKSLDLAVWSASFSS